VFHVRLRHRFLTKTNVSVPLFECLDLQRMRQVRRVSWLVRQNAVSIQAALPFRRLLHLAESRIAQHFAEITEIERDPVLTIAEIKIGKPAAERIEVAREGSSNDSLRRCI
jgi:hypothetical protein